MSFFRVLEPISPAWLSEGPTVIGLQFELYEC